MDIRMWLKIFKRVFFHPRCLKVLGNTEILYHDYFIEKYGMEKGPPLAGIFDIVDEVDEEIKPFLSNFVGSDLVTIALLKAIARQYDNCKFLEIGTYQGTTTQNMDEVVKSGVTVDMREDAFNFMKPDCKIHRVIQDSTEGSWWSMLDKFDLIYVDASHHYEDVKSDTENVFKVLADGGTIVFDDAVDRSFGYSVPAWFRWDVISAVYDGCPEDKRDNLYLVSNMCNIIYTEREIPKRSEYADYLVKIKMGIKKLEGRS
jgi:SAM-dependent methyltransferase